MKYYLFTVLTILSTNVSLAQTDYQNDLVKLKMQSPTNWKYAGTDESKKNLKEIKFTDEQLKVISSSNNGIISQISYYKYNQDSVTGFIPTVKITVRLNPAKTFDEFKTIMINSANRLKLTLSDFEYLDQVKTVKLSDHNSIYYSCRYSITPASSEKFNVRTISYNIPRGRYFVSITFMDNDSTEDCSNLFNGIIKTIKITD